VGVSRDYPNFLSTPYIISRMGKNYELQICMGSTFTGYIRTKVIERGRIQGLLKFFEYPLLSQEWVKAQTTNFVCTFTGSIGSLGTFPHNFMEVTKLLWTCYGKTGVMDYHLNTVHININARFNNL